MRADRSTVGADFSTAHVHSPMGGQGMDAGLQVAHHLVNLLAGIGSGLRTPELLNGTRRRRRSDGPHGGGR